jgi:hypothetical protein
MESRSGDVVAARRCLWSWWLYRVPRGAEDTDGGDVCHRGPGLSLGGGNGPRGPVSLYLREREVLCLSGVRRKGAGFPKPTSMTRTSRVPQSANRDK